MNSNTFDSEVIAILEKLSGKLFCDISDGDIDDLSAKLGEMNAISLGIIAIESGGLNEFKGKTEKCEHCRIYPTDRQTEK